MFSVGVCRELMALLAVTKGSQFTLLIQNWFIHCDSTVLDGIDLDIGRCTQTFVKMLCWLMDSGIPLLKHPRVLFLISTYNYYLKCFRSMRYFLSPLKVVAELLLHRPDIT